MLGIACWSCFEKWEWIDGHEMARERRLELASPVSLVNLGTSSGIRRRHCDALPVAEGRQGQTRSAVRCRAMAAACVPEFVARVPLTAATPVAARREQGTVTTVRLPSRVEAVSFRRL
jgi:hypothetical protein